MGNSSSKKKYDAYEDEWLAPPYPPRGPRDIDDGVPPYALSMLSHGMVGMIIMDMRFTNSEALAALQQQILPGRVQERQSPTWWQQGEPIGPENRKLASMGMIEGDGMRIPRRNRPGGGAIGMHQSTLSGQKRVPNRRAYTEVNAVHRLRAGSHNHSQVVKEKSLERSESECIEWDTTCEEVSKIAETTGQVERDVEKRRMLKETGMCPMGCEWIRHKDGWRCWGGNHFVFHNQQLADKFVEWLQTLDARNHDD
ncbi:MAG: hypothetical protein Q9186_006219 [Xanthomendoza sp. 1 TL-2023]